MKMSHALVYLMFSYLSGTYSCSYTIVYLAIHEEIYQKDIKRFASIAQNSRPGTNINF